MTAVLNVWLSGDCGEIIEIMQEPKPNRLSSEYYIQVCDAFGKRANYFFLAYGAHLLTLSFHSCFFFIVFFFQLL